jgi:hypothetical protein
MKSIITVVILIFCHKRIFLKPPFQENSRQKGKPIAGANIYIDGI